MKLKHKILLKQKFLLQFQLWKHIPHNLQGISNIKLFAATSEKTDRSPLLHSDAVHFREQKPFYKPCMLEASEPHIPSATNQCTVAASAEACQTLNRTLSSLNVYCIICLVLIVRLNSVYRLSKDWWLPSHGVRGTKGCRKGQHWLGFQKPLC